GARQQPDAGRPRGADPDRHRLRGGLLAETACHMGAFAGWNTPLLSASSSSRMTCSTALISARWVNACGKLPRCCPLWGSISSPYSSSGPANESSFAHSLRALLNSPISHSAETSQNEQIVN